MKIFNIKPISLAISMIILSSCNKLVQVDPPVSRLTKDAVFTSDQSALSALAGLYSSMMQTNLLFSSDAMTVYPGMSADELNNSYSGVDDEFSHNTLSTSNPVLQRNIWSFGYNYIYQANSILEGLQNSSTISPEVKAQFIGEALLIRAFCYFYLTNLFGDVPLVTTTNAGINAQLGRSLKAQIYLQIISDLKRAEALMSPDYLTGDKGRPNKWAASALLSRVYLYLKDYSSAEAEASSIINSGLYSLNNDLNQVFLANSPEAIWQLVPVQPNYNTWEGNTFNPGMGLAPVYALDSFLLNRFEAGDQRLTAWTSFSNIGGTNYYFPFKYKVRVSSTITEYYTVLRLAEQFLIRAEARAEQDNIVGAQEDLNLIRIRAGLPNSTATDKSSLLVAILHERQVELFSEWGHRWLDLKRTGQADSILGSEKKSTWRAADTLYPIPLKEIQANPALTQNPGY